MNDTCTVYCLTSSEDDRVRYVGQTEACINKRLSQHLAESKRSDYRVSRWIRKSIKNGFQINIEVLEKRADVNASEIEWIKFFRGVYSDMTNISSGGDRGCFGLKRSDETKAKMRKPKSKKARLNMCKLKSKEARINMSKAQVGNVKSRGESNRHAVLTIEKVAHIKNELLGKFSLTEIAGMYGVKKSAISKIKTGRTWAYV